MLEPRSTDDTDPSLTELVEFSSRALLRKAAQRTESDVLAALGQTGWVTLRDYSIENFEEFEETVIEASGAATLMPLRERDIAVLAELFKQDQIDEIEADILRSLLQRCPEPCWEDDPMEFLEEFL